MSKLIEAVRADQSRALVVRGDAGVGKTVLLEYLAVRASGLGCLVARAMGVESEMELAFAGLHQLFAPMLDQAEMLPGPQRDALGIALGLAAGPPPDRFLVGADEVGDVFERHPVGTEQGDERVAEFSPHPVGTQARYLSDLPKLAQHVVTIQWRPDRRGENQAVIVPQRSGLEPVGGLELVVFSERLHG